MNFWQKLAKKGSIVGLSPMDGVTDAPMRYMTAKYGRPDVIFTEFVNVDGLHYATGERRERLLKTLMRASEVGRLDKKPFEVAQVFGKNPEFFAEAAALIEKLGFDGIDINMGCPAHKVEENGSGAGLIRNPSLAQAIIRATKAVTKLPVSVKTRIGVDRDVAEEWMKTLMEVKPEMISLHGRTLKQLYQGTADWEAIGRAARVVHELGGHILGNGDVNSIQMAKLKCQKYGVDGVLIGRAAEGNPGIFAGIDEPSWEERKAWMLEHARIFEQIFRPADPPSLDELRKGTRQEHWFLPVRKHLAWYCKGFSGASEVREKLVRCNSVKQLEYIL